MKLQSTRKRKLKLKPSNKTYKQFLKGKFLTAHSIKKTYHGRLFKHPSKPLKSYKLKVSDIHTISFKTYGNKNGKPILYVHGGPGGGTRPSMARFFNPLKYYIVLVDQRGCGNSKPTAETRENTTDDRADDFEKVREKLGIKKWIVFGGSWGSTLGLYYAIKYPDVVSHMVLRAIFLGTQEEIDWLSESNGAENINPIGWEYYKNAIPKQYRTNYMDAYGKCFKGVFGKKKRSECLLSWAAWEEMNLRINMPTLKYTISNLKKDKTYETVALIEHHYLTNKCFMEEGFLTKKENIDKIRHIPTVIIQGIYDIICPFKYGYLLHKAFPEAKFYPTMAGHSSYDIENMKHIIETTNHLAK